MNPTSLGNPVVNIAIFAAFVVVTLAIVIRVSTGGKKRAGDFYTGGAQFSGRQNGFAIAGDYLSAASFLGIAGAVALYGYDGLLYSIGFLVAWLVALLLVAEPLRNTGRYTMADVLSFRMKQRPVRLAAAISTLLVSFFYLLAQMAGAGALVNLLLGVQGDTAQSIVIGIVGLLMIAYVLIGGMKGTTWVQMIKAILLVGGVLVMTIWVMALNGFDLGQVIQAAIDRANATQPGTGEKLIQPMGRYGTNKLGFISLSIALVLGAAGLPHVLMRFYTVPTAKEARRSVTWAIGLIGAFYLMTIVIGYGAAAMVGADAINALPGKANAAAPALAFALGGTVLLALIAGVAFATILAVVAGLTITASASLAHDIYNSVIKHGQATPAAEVRVARITVLVIGVLAIVGGIAAKSMNVAFLVSLAFAIAASANLPSILYSLYWRGFKTQGSVWSIYGGLISSLVLIIFSPAVSGMIGSTKPLSSAMFPNAHFAWFPLDNPALVSVPIGFFLGWLGSVLSKEDNTALSAEMEVRSMTGAGAHKALDH
ncbi:solute symporter family protein [Enemella evansiae]|uniref:Cation acetate symporter n=1 Tax=Enemella evansiae TaxID=2016499 RepID=A0A255GG20_9ACTN|nr:cation acetate symporter [Enemella evansiae]PFG68355.1 cation/acetate symporter [Propionibacteriaceae bacterium ES.041]OYN95600.1 cation acetate symporter [Enemella evansiae]OYO00306.1 cation acetate symporter [Enemella evansiae]OYO03705.1 cation acetate symporter [Enemella evansiae]OYO10137.1 cation acetate symporter [Enemella evansiae]